MNPQLLAAGSVDPESPATYSVALETNKGAIIVDVRRALAPRGADRFHRLAHIGFLEDVAFFRVIAGFMAQAGLHGDPAVSKVWRNARFPDDPVRETNAAGTVSFATSGKDSRTTQFFINLADNKRLDAMGFSPFGRVRDLEIVRALHAGYGEAFPHGAGPQQGRIQREGNAYLRADFPELDYIRRASLL
jgi:peptidyl-prolyl cis-trans isomerase A (cyclophilin A)